MAEKTLFEEFIDAGASAMLAAMRGDQEEWKRLVEKGRKLKVELDRQEVSQLFAESDAKHRTQREEKRLPKLPKTTTNLGDVFKAAGIVKEEGGK